MTAAQPASLPAVLAHFCRIQFNGAIFGSCPTQLVQATVLGIAPTLPTRRRSCCTPPSRAWLSRRTSCQSGSGPASFRHRWTCGSRNAAHPAPRHALSGALGSAGGLGRGWPRCRASDWSALPRAVAGTPGRRDDHAARGSLLVPSGTWPQSLDLLRVRRRDLVLGDAHVQAADPAYGLRHSASGVLP